ncbi:osmoprotectant transport system permease protein [Agreia bicolorata]|uniref:Osmoprotectant transport system permease protein n=1 Tax=Agreia bicolorata TaxID=110935 RepID=A0A1T4YIN3_9MICO|nr:ABC transporter permease [Agreia bicolorata]SKB01664.1 osmoprotectant transport system permease protein [Agreia bicolorata]
MNWVIENLPLIGQRTLEHLALSIPPIVLSFVLSVPIGWLANRYRWSRGVLLTVLGLLYAIPSLPLFVVLPIILGTGLRDSVNVIVALTLYGIALMVRTTADALGSVSSDVTQSATAMGFSPWTRFWRVDLPLAGPVLLAGIRVVAVSTVSLVTVGAVLGIKSLGLLFTDGLQRNIVAEVATGMVATIALALVIDFALVLAGRMLMPWTRTVSPKRERRELPVDEAVTA